MKITLVFNSSDAAEEAWIAYFDESEELWNAYFDREAATIEIERYDQQEPIFLAIPENTISIIL